MTDWSSGYVTDVAYTHGYYAELNPLRARLPLLNAGIAPPAYADACELGYGQGMSLNIHAAASGARWHGTDFNPAHAAFAQATAAASGAQAHVSEESFAEFCARTDLPDFDFIGLHGIFSWISPENQRAIVDFAARKLRPGGVLYVSYNAMPGWAAMAPVQELLYLHNATLGAPGQGILARFDAALQFVEKLLATNPVYLRANPTIAERIKKIKGQDKSYLVHEYFDRDWAPLSFARAKALLAPAKLSFACPAVYLDHVDTLNLAPDHRELLKSIPDPALRETVRDLCLNTQFRKDYWIKGPRRLTPLAQAEALRAQRVILTLPRAGVPLKIKGPLGEAELQPSVYVPILDVLAGHKPTTLGQIEQALAGKGPTLGQIVQALMVLIHAGSVAPAQDDAATAAARRQADRLNAFAWDLARANADVQYLASPVTGGGVAVARFAQLFLLAGAQGRKTAEDRARFAWEVLAPQGQQIVKDGKPLATPEQNLAELTAQARTFVDQSLPALTALGVTG